MNAVPQTVELLRASGAVRAELTYGERDSESCWVRVAYAAQSFVGEGSDYFDALVALRRQLEALSILIRVNGAGQNVWPSGMSRSMGSGIQAYRMTLGSQARTVDLVHIFECSTGIEPATITEQERFRDQWFASLGSA
jgi:hypothetical protein